MTKSNVTESRNTKMAYADSKNAQITQPRLNKNTKLKAKPMNTIERTAHVCVRITVHIAQLSFTTQQ